MTGPKVAWPPAVKLTAWPVTWLPLASATVAVKTWVECPSAVSFAGFGETLMLAGAPGTSASEAVAVSLYEASPAVIVSVWATVEEVRVKV